ncbi:MFS transporter [Salinactinospora qingdaonensis]|uniref:Major facilitator superfamily (MFS) profile domain-containing protein n=1 Tax=Salinactinospora qingdaonensis TaxID=702744 RepID=A0ABP7FU71_9ACTN
MAFSFIAVAQLMIVFDTTVVNIAMPSAQQELNMSDGDRQWIITAYALAFGGLLLFGGRVTDLVGRKRTFLAGLVGFAVASAVAGTGPQRADAHRRARPTGHFRRPTRPFGAGPGQPHLSGGP